MESYLCMVIKIYNPIHTTVVTTFKAININSKRCVMF